jgi:hypothetical protein
MTLFSGTFHQKPAPFSFGVASFRSETRMIRENHATFSFQPGTFLRKDGTMSEKDRTMSKKDGTMSEKDRTMSEKDRTMSKKDGTMDEKDGTMSKKDGTMDEKDETFLRKDGMTDKKTGNVSRFPSSFPRGALFSPNEKPVAHSNVVELPFLAQRITSLF